LAQQAAIALGGAQTSDGQVIPPSPPLAKHFIDMLDMVQQKTKGNLTKEEGEVLNALLSRLRWAFSMGMAPPPGTATGGAPPAGGAKPKPQS
jgi:hypothetical protein